jgi:hypothetical protein
VNSTVIWKNGSVVANELGFCSSVVALHLKYAYQKKRCEISAMGVLQTFNYEHHYKTECGPKRALLWPNVCQTCILGTSRERRCI